MNNDFFFILVLRLYNHHFNDNHNIIIKSTIHYVRYVFSDLIELIFFNLLVLVACFFLV